MTMEDITNSTSTYFPLTLIVNNSAATTVSSNATIFADRHHSVASPHLTSAGHHESSNATVCHGSRGKCSHGKLIPSWEPSPLLMPIEVRAGRAVFLIIVMAYLFLGINIICDKFVEAIEVVVSQKKRKKVVSPVTGAEEVIEVPIWNETVAHLTLAVVGSCSPEIMLTTVEVLTNNFAMGELGPATIVGSGAYNLFIITTVCILSVASGESRSIKDMHIFFVSSAWAIFAYVWLYLLISVMSPGEIEAWEAILTLALFPVTVLTSYLADKQCFGLLPKLSKLHRASTIMPYNGKMGVGNGIERNGSLKGFRANSLHNVALHVTRRLRAVSIFAAASAHHPLPMPMTLRNGDVEPRKQGPGSQFSTMNEVDEMDENVEDTKHRRVEERERRFMEIQAEQRRKFPGKSNHEINEMAQLELVKHLPKSMSYYRSQAMRRMAGSEDVITRKKLRASISKNLEKAQAETAAPIVTITDPNKQIVRFDPAVYTVCEDAGNVELTIVRDGLDLDNEISVGYVTMDGTAKGGVDFHHVDGRVHFRKGERSHAVPVGIIDDDVFNDDTVFYVNLHDPIVHTHRTLLAAPDSDQSATSLAISLVDGFRAKVTKLDDDQGGVFHFESNALAIEENIGETCIKVIRSVGGKGCVKVPVLLLQDSAKRNEQYKDQGVIEVTFENKQLEGFVRFAITDEGKLDKQASLQIVLGEPKWSSVQNVEDFDIAELGPPRLSTPSSMTLTITASSKLKKIVDGIAGMDVYTNFAATSTWREQFKSAWTVGGGQQDGQGEDEGSTSASRPQWYDYVLHIIAFVWKMLMALVPPTEMGHGWPAAFCCLAIMAFVTAVIADLAEQLGCTVGLSDELTAITFVSLGTSLPDMFASRIAAKNEETADAAIGHISGATAANVFFGIGLAWTIAAVQNTIAGRRFVIEAGSLGFSITLYFTFAAITIGILLLRRLPPVRGELGGPMLFRILTALLFVGFWITYVALSALDNYCVITTY